MFTNIRLYWLATRRPIYGALLLLALGLVLGLLALDGTP